MVMASYFTTKRTPISWNAKLHLMSSQRLLSYGRSSAGKGYTAEQLPVITQDYYDDGSGKSPRYYQLQAINKTPEAISAGRNRILLVMATGTGKTYTAFQINWRLWKGRHKKRILFLADRNILVDQTRTNDFQPFGQAMTKITGRTVDPAYEIHQALSPSQKRVM